jgi:hypothetical protein
MTESEIFISVRKLAKSDHYQMLYAQAKELHFKLFKNDSDLSHLQMTFLNYLLFYHNIYIDIAMKDVDEIVMEDEIYEDAWTYYKHNRKQKEESKLDNKLPKQKMDRESKETFQWVFKRPAKGVK